MQTCVEGARQEEVEPSHYHVVHRIPLPHESLQQFVFLGLSNVSSYNSGKVPTNVIWIKAPKRRCSEDVAVSKRRTSTRRPASLADAVIRDQSPYTRGNDSLKFCYIEV
jgi:hypothetical protein